MKINLNARVRVTLTPAGVARILARDVTALPKTILFDRGVWETQLWELMVALGPTIYAGGPLLVVDNAVEVLAETE
jgi:hypothetical protein